MGNFTCIVNDTDGNSNEKTMELEGLSYLQHIIIYKLFIISRYCDPLMPLTVGSHATVTCLSPSGMANEIKWFDSKGNSLINTTSMQELMLVLDPVNDSGSNFI